MTCAQKNHLLLGESRTFRGRVEINLLVHACHSISLFSFLISNFPFLFLFLFFSQYLFPCCDLLLEVTITVIMIPLLCTTRVLYIVLAVTDFYYFSLQLPLSGLGVLTDHHWFVNYLTSTTYLCWLCHSLSPNKEGYFVRLFAVALLPATVWVLSLSIPHGMHLVVSTHPCFFWVVCHPNRTFPIKESV